MNAERLNPTEHAVNDLIQRRWSPVAFDSTPLEDESVARLVEAARWSASCFNAQPWRFVLGRRGQGDSHARLNACLAEANQVWAQHAPLLVLVVAQKDFEHNGKSNGWAWYDCGQAATQMILQAVSMGLFAHSMAGFDAEKARKTFAIPPGYEPACVIAIGARALDASHLPKDTQLRDAGPRSRKPLADCVFEGDFGQPSPVIDASGS